jgi:AcrR family transcriptional regulator
LFKATLEILDAQGMEGVSFASVGKSAGVNRSTLYRRWPNPAVLVVEAIAAQIEADVTVADTGTLRGDMRDTLTSLARFLQSSTGRAGLAAAASLAGDPQAAVALRGLWVKRLSHLQQIFERAQSRREIPSVFDGEAFIATMSGALLFRILIAAEKPDAAWIERIMDMAAVLMTKTR